MEDKPTTADREQQKADNVASRRQSGLEPLPRDRDEPSEEPKESAGDDGADTSQGGGEQDTPGS